MLCPTDRDQGEKMKQALIGNARWWTICLCLASTLNVSSAISQNSESAAIDLPPQRLSSALTTIGDAYGVTIFAPGELTRGRTAPALAGTMTSIEAVSRLLEGSQLDAKFTSGGAIVISQRVLPDSQSALPPRQATSVDSESEIEEIIVVGDAFSETDGLLARQSSTGSRFPVDVEKLPNTIRILPQQLIDDTRATLPQELTKYVPGVQTVPAFGSSVGFVIRGFFADYESLQNGVRISDSPGDLSNVERIEVLKGPIGSLYGGTGAFAGTVNIVTKRPLDQFAADMTAYAGSENFYRVEGDVGGPLTSDGVFTYRLTGAAESAGSFRENADSRKFVISPSVAYEPNERVSIRLDGSYLDRDYTFLNGLPLLDGSSPSGVTTLDIDPSATFFAPDRSQTEDDYASLGGEGNFELTDDLTLRVAGLYANYDIEIGSSRLFAGVLEDGRTLDRFTAEGPQQFERNTVQVDLIYRLPSLGVETVVLGGYERFTNDYTFNISGRALPPVDLLTPVNPAVGPGAIDPQFDGFLSYEGDAVYAQIFSQVTPNIAVLAGLRYDWQTNSSAFNGDGTTISDSQPSPRVGLTWSVTDDTTLFANLATSFSPNFGLDRDGRVFDPDTVRQYEGGIRQKLFDDRALFTLAYFDIRRSNVVIPDITDFTRQIAGGVQTSRGVEFDLTGRLAPGVDVSLTYAYNDTEVARPEDPNFGEQLPAAPEHGASAFVSYRFKGGALEGLSANAGLTYTSRIQASLPSSIFIPEETRLDLAVAYELQNRWRVGVNVNNVTDSGDGYSTDFFSVSPLAPRQVLLTVSRSFGD